MGELATMDLSGDTKVYWDARVPAEVENARQTFRTLRGKGYAAYKLAAGGAQGEQLLDFDPAAERIILVPAMQGG